MIKARLFLLLGISLAASAQLVPLPAQAAAAAPKPAAPPDGQDPLNRVSPQSTVIAFLDTCKAHNYERALRYLDLTQFVAQKRLDEGKQLAQELAQILENDAQFDVAALSRNPEGAQEPGMPANRERVVTFHLPDEAVELDLERVQLRGNSYVWRFPTDSVQKIPRLVIATSQSPIERHLPAPLVRLRFLDTSAWRWIALLVLGIAVWLLCQLICSVAALLVTPALQRLALVSPWLRGLSDGGAKKLVDSFIGPLQLLVGVALFGAGVQWIEPAPLPKLYIVRTLAILSLFGFAWLCARVIDLGVQRLRKFLESKHPGFSRSVLPLTARVLKITILALGFIAILSNWGYDTRTILAGLGIGGIAIALASQKTIENLFGSVAVISDHPVHVGDFCKAGNKMGTVEDIGLRSTKLRTPDRTLVTIPNAEFSAMTLENYSQRDKMLFHQTLNLRRDTSPRQVQAVLDSILAILKQRRDVETGGLPVRFVGVGAYSLDVEIFAYVLTGDGDKFLQAQQELLLKILDAVAAAGTALALPTQASVEYSVEPRAPQNGVERDPALRR